VLNNAHRVADGKDHSDVVLNNAHRVSDGKNHSDVVLNNTHRTSVGLDHAYLKNNLADAVIAVANATGGGTTAALTVDLKDLDGGALSKTGIVMVRASAAEGSPTLNGNVTFGTATKGSILATAAGWAIVKCDANGQFACTATNAVDETVYFVVVNANGVDAVANGIAVRGCLSDAATWSA